jgi:hypothetical protein
MMIETAGPIVRRAEPGDGSAESNATESRRDDLLQTRFRMNMGRVNGLMKLVISDSDSLEPRRFL